MVCWGTFADLSHEADAEIRGLDEARRRIAELEREIKKRKNSKTMPQIEHAGIERAVRVAVEHERASWRQKFEQGRGVCGI